MQLRTLFHEAVNMNALRRALEVLETCKVASRDLRDTLTCETFQTISQCWMLTDMVRWNVMFKQLSQAQNQLIETQWVIILISCIFCNLLDIFQKIRGKKLP